MLLSSIKLRHIATDHQPYHVVVIDFCPRQLSGVFPISQDGHAIGEFGDFTQAMRNVDHTDTAISQILDHAKKLLGFVRRKAGRRFVHNQNASINRQRLGDFHHLLATDGQRVDGCRGSDVQADAFEHPMGIAIQLLAIDQAELARRPR